MILNIIRGKKLTLVLIVIAAFGIKSQLLFAQINNCITINSDLKNGSNGNEVKKLQVYLISKGYFHHEVTGYFGSITRKAVQEFQKDHRIDPVGKVGPITKKFIFSDSCSVNVSTTPTTKPDEPIIAQLPVISKITLPYTSTNFEDWNLLWGNSNTVNSTLNLTASTSTNGAEVILLNSSHWTDYKFNLNIFVKQASVVMLTRYVNEDNFLGCSFTGRYIEIIQRINGVTEVVAYTTLSDFPKTSYFYDDLNLSTEVRGNKIGCTLVGGSSNVEYDKINPSLLNGGVGVQIHSNALNVASVGIKNIYIQKI